MVENTTYPEWQAAIRKAQAERNERKRQADEERDAKAREDAARRQREATERMNIVLEYLGIDDTTENEEYVTGNYALVDASVRYRIIHMTTPQPNPFKNPHYDSKMADWNRKKAEKQAELDALPLADRIERISVTVEWREETEEFKHAVSWNEDYKRQMEYEYHAFDMYITVAASGGNHDEFKANFADALDELKEIRDDLIRFYKRDAEVTREAESLRLSQETEQEATPPEPTVAEKLEALIREIAAGEGVVW